MERGSPFHSEKFCNERNSPTYPGETLSEDMTQDSVPSEEDNKEHIQLLNLKCGNTDNCSLKTFESEHNVIEGEKEQNNVHQNTDNCNVEKPIEDNREVQLDNSCSEPVRSESDSVKCDKFNNSGDFTISNSVNSMKSIRMNIRRKRFCSNSSAVSNNDSVSGEKRPGRRLKKRRKRIAI